MNLNLKHFFLMMLLALPLWSFGQPIFLDNPSFEGPPRGSLTPAGWFDCGFPGETPPDTHPSGAFEVTTQSYNGNSYLGLVTRGNDTWEAIGQMLNTSLEMGQCYEFEMKLARSSRYWSASKWSQSYDDYIGSCVVRIWGGNSYCDKKELLDETGTIQHTEWKNYKFKFKPRRNFKFILIEVFYKTPTLFAYNGNVLLDNCSAIISCGEEFPEDPEISEPIAENINVPPKDPKVTDPVSVKPKDPIEVAGNNSTPPPPKTEKFIPELDRSTIKEGDKIRVENIYFEADTFKIDPKSFPTLQELYSFLNNNKDVKIEIGGHTNGLPPHSYCDKLSQDRSESVKNYLVKKGISPFRIEAKGYGKRDPIANNDTVSGRKKNQRVEIKILKLGR